MAIEELIGWTKEDKFNLMIAIKSSRSLNPKTLCCLVTNKSKEDITTAIKFYKRKASGRPFLVRTKREKRTDNAPRGPLACWAKVLTDRYKYDDLRTEIAIALRSIADFETFPMPITTHGVDFRRIYHILANAVEGKQLSEEELACLTLDKCLTDTAFLTRSHVRGSVLKYVVHTIDLEEKDVQSFSKPIPCKDLTVLKMLAAEKSSNPLCIPEGLLLYSAMPNEV